MLSYSQLLSTDDQALLEALKALPPFPSHIRHCLITGPEHRQAQEGVNYLRYRRKGST